MLIPTSIYYIEFVSCEFVNTFLEILGNFLRKSHLVIVDVL